MWLHADCSCHFLNWAGYRLWSHLSNREEGKWLYNLNSCKKRLQWSISLSLHWQTITKLLSVFMDRLLNKCCNNKVVKKNLNANLIRIVHFFLFVVCFQLHSALIIMWKLHSTLSCAGDKRKQLRKLSGIQ